MYAEQELNNRPSKHCIIPPEPDGNYTMVARLIILNVVLPLERSTRLAIKKILRGSSQVEEIY
jgi:hypothetical protein